MLLSAALLAGCGKPKAAQNAAPNSSANPGEPAGAEAAAQAPVHGTDLQMPAPSGPIVIPDTGDPNAVVSRLSLELRRYVLRTRTAPESFEDFVAKAQVQAPPPPAGKKYLIQAGAVVLAKR